MNLKTALPLLLFCFGSALYAQTVEPAQSETPSQTTLDTLSKPVQAPVIDTVSKTIQTPVPVAAPVSNNQRTEQVAKPVAASNSVSADMSSTLKGGFYIRLGLMNPSSSYMIENPKTGYNFQLGSQYYIGPIVANYLRFGLDVSWFDLSYAKLDVKDGHSGIVSLLGVGPMVSVAPVKRLAITTYVKAMPSFNFAVGEEQMGFYEDGTAIPVSSSDAAILKTVARGGFNINGLWGIEMRYSLFDIGFDLNWGKPDFKEISAASGFKVQTNSYKINNSRLYIGIRF
ncbi:MAG: hypothetical protein P4L28_05870 [Paludibacteraceae bacterium]|nr:hypothetical protein [Paludibacteraceae bacterium]